MRQYAFIQLIFFFLQPSPAEVDLSQLGVFNRTINSLHGSLRWKQRSPAHMLSLTENALKKVYNHVSLTVSHTHTQVLIRCLFVCLFVFYSLGCLKWFVDTWKESMFYRMKIIWNKLSTAMKNASTSSTHVYTCNSNIMLYVIGFQWPTLVGATPPAR